MTTTLAPAQTADDRHSGRPSRLRRLILGDTTQPWWARPALWAVLALATFLYSWHLSRNGTANAYYAAAVQAGRHSWKAFFFGSVDAGSYITVDKPPMHLWVMGLFARVFGFGTWSLLIPQTVEAVAAVAVLYTAVRRTFSAAAGIIAALVLTLTPMTVAINRDNNPDTLLVLLLVLAGWACLEATRTGRPQPLVWSAIALGCAFNTKMMQAFLVLPAFVLTYLFAAAPPLWTRIRNMSIFAVVLAVASGWWLVVVDLVPKADRPFVGGSTDDTVWNLVVGYNGVGRLVGGEQQKGLFTNPNDHPGLFRLFSTEIGGQITWLVPLALILGAVALVLRGRRPRTDSERAGLLLWAGWFAVHFLAFSLAVGIFHPYYTTAMVPGMGALIGAGGVASYRAFQRSQPWGWALPIGLAITGVWSIVLLRRVPSFVPWLAPTIGVVLGLALVALVVFRLSTNARPVLLAASAVVAVAAALAGSTAYAVTPLTFSVWGVEPLAGPAVAGQDPGRPGPNTPAGRAASVDPQVVNYLRHHQDGATWLVALNNARSADAIMLQTGEPVMPIGGWRGIDPALTVDELDHYVASGKLHYVLLGGTDPKVTPAISGWVSSRCTTVDPAEYGRAASPGQQVLYRCG
jgi:4-amino-4-deoxy-L-arabinose transferase-like glycosyltransferase